MLTPEQFEVGLAESLTSEYLRRFERNLGRATRVTDPTIMRYILLSSALLVGQVPSPYWGDFAKSQWSRLTSIIDPLQAMVCAMLSVMELLSGEPILVRDLVNSIRRMLNAEASLTVQQTAWIGSGRGSAYKYGVQKHGSDSTGLDLHDIASKLAEVALNHMGCEVIGGGKVRMPSMFRNELIAKAVERITHKYATLAPGIIASEVKRRTLTDPNPGYLLFTPKCPRRYNYRMEKPTLEPAEAVVDRLAGYEALYNMERTTWAVNTNMLNFIEANKIYLNAQKLVVFEHTDKGGGHYNVKWLRESMSLRTIATLNHTVIMWAHKLAGLHKFHFEYFLDSRGRTYTCNSILSPQGTDLAKSLLYLPAETLPCDHMDYPWVQDVATYGYSHVEDADFEPFNPTFYIGCTH